MAAGSGMMLQVNAAQIPQVAEYLSAASGPGIVVCGSDVDVPRLRRDLPSWGITFDLGAWRSEISTAQRPLALPTGTLFDLSLHDYVSEQVQAGVEVVLAPSLYIPHGQSGVFHSLLREFEKIDNPAFLPLVVVPHSALGGNWKSDLENYLTSLGRPSGLITVGDPRVLNNPDRLAHLRDLVRTGRVSHVLATEPAIASDLLAHGAVVASVGLSSSLRIPWAPSKGGPRSSTFLPAAFYRELLQVRSPSVVADWFAGSGRQPKCGRCGNLALLDGTNPQDRARILAHNLHELADYAWEYNRVPADLVAEWSVDQLADAVRAHPNPLALDSYGGPLPVLCQLNGISLDLEPARTP